MEERRSKGPDKKEGHEMGYEVLHLKRSKSGMKTAMTLNSFVRVRHMESGISVTKYNKVSMKAYEQVYAECEELVRIWKNS